MKKVFSWMLAVILTVYCIPLQVFAIDKVECPTVTIETVYAAAGQTVDVNVDITENTGIFGAILTFEFPPELALNSVTKGDAFADLDISLPDSLTSPYTIFCDGLDKPAISDGTIVSFKFTVSEDVQANTKLAITASYLEGDVVDGDFNDQELNIVNGAVSIIDYIPGDVNGDGRINTTDVTWIRRYRMGGYDLPTFNEAAADVNNDGRINTIDVTRIRQYRMGGYGVVLLPSTPKCPHSMTATPAVDATCTEAGNIAYWYCSLCQKHFSDADGKTEIAVEDAVVAASHNLVHMVAKAATYDEPGHIEHWHCGGCGKYFSNSSATTEVAEDKVLIPQLTRAETTVVYNVYGSDPYLERVGIDNSINKTVFNSEDGLILNDLIAPAGYIFKGWTTAAGVPITEIPSSSASRQIVLNATWSKVEYTVTFDSPDVPVDPIKYTVDTGATFENAAWYGYTFVGWSNDNGFLIKNIKPGTTGNFTLHANWTSNRNMATSYENYGEPIAIIEDDKTGQFLFVYNIGKIDNVPLGLIEHIGNSQTININQSYQVSNTITQTEAETIAEMISKATTESSGWTLSSDWETIYSAGSEEDETRGKTEERIDTEGNVVGGNYYVSNSQGGSSFVSTNSGGSSSNSSKVTKDASVGIHSNYKTSTETDASVNLGVKNETEVSAGVSFPVKVVDVSAGIKNTTTVSADTSLSRNDKESFELDTQKSYAVGTVDESHSNSYYNVTAENSSNWNTTSGYEKSYQSSTSSSVANAISEQISKKTTLNVSEAVGGQTANSSLSTDTSGKTNEYSSVISYAEGTGEITTKEVKFTSDRPGYYRLVTAGTVHVFGVVGYDVATSSYFTYTYSMLDNERHTYLDYSKDDPRFLDCQNAVVPFEIPYYPQEYVASVVGRSEGLQVDLEGYITGYTGTDTTVVIPQYWQTDNGDGTFSAIKIRGIKAGLPVFAGNTNVEKIILPCYVTEIPDNAFEGCTSLETVIASGVTKIGKEAFKGCSALATFTLDEYVVSLGAGAFDGVNKLVVMAANASVADAVIASGANDITLNLSKLDKPLTNKKLEIGSDTKRFTLVSNGTAYAKLQIVSKAEETYLSNFSLVENVDTPLEIESQKVTLNRITVQEAPGFALILPYENTEIKLYGNNEFSSTGDHAVLCKNANLSLQNAVIASKMIVSGNLLTCGAIDGTSLLTINDGELINISLEEFEQYRSSIVVSFDSNGGSDVTTENRVYYGQTYGELPVPTRANHGFIGWFTKADGGEQITSSSVVSAHVNQTLYAHWAPNQFTLTYNANGGSCSVASKALTFGDTFGELPNPTRTHYTFDGWYTAASGGTKVSASTKPTSSDNVTIYAHWTLVPYTVTWNTGVGYSIAVSRTSSPKANKATGTLSKGATVYYGDVLSITYTASTGYSITAKGIVSTTVVGNVTASDIYATASLNSYTYNIVYKSSNGTALGSSSATYKYGTTNTISAPAKSGYNTPSSQSVKWDSTSAKTITFTYSPASVSNSTKSGTIFTGPTITYSARLEYRNRTATSVQVRVVWTSTIAKGGYDSYGQRFKTTIGSNSNTTTVNNYGTWKSSSSSARSSTGTSGWITVPLSTTNATSASVSIYYYQVNANGTDMTYHYGVGGMNVTWKVNIPAY